MRLGFTWTNRLFGNPGIPLVRDEMPGGRYTRYRSSELRLFGSDSPSTTLPSMPVGSIRPKSRSACFPGNVWANAESPTWKPCAPRLRHGTSTSTVTEPSLNGTSLASTPRDVSTIKQTYLHGHGTSVVRHTDGCLTVFEGHALYRLRKNSCSVSGHNFSCALEFLHLPE